MRPFTPSHAFQARMPHMHPLVKEPVSTTCRGRAVACIQASLAYGNLGTSTKLQVPPSPAWSSSSIVWGESTWQKKPLCRNQLYMSPVKATKSSAYQETEQIEQDGQVGMQMAGALNKASSRLVTVMLSGNEEAAFDLALELDDLKLEANEAGDKEAASFLIVLQGLLNHEVLVSEAQGLPESGPHMGALERLLNTVQGSDWMLMEEGKPDLPDSGQPSFSTWEDVLNKKKKKNAGSKQETAQGASASSSRPGQPGRPLDTKYYDVLGISPSASTAEIKQAYRKAALRVHPDVSTEQDAEQQFLELSTAYDVLSAEESRKLYDIYGPEGMKGRSGASAGFGNARDAWDEFRPYKRENKHTRARDASRASTSESSMSSTDGEEDDGDTANKDQSVPHPGDLVEYPLSDVVKSDLKDGRSHGVALLVSRNMDRGDAASLPPELLDLCEVEPLRQEESGSTRWIADELSTGGYVHLPSLRKLMISSFDSRFDVWTIGEPLSPGCGGPDLPEEIML